MRAIPGTSFVQLKASDADAALLAIANAAVAEGFAQPSFPAALVERERRFPTALPTIPPVAIPHADAAHIIQPGFAIATLSEPVEFRIMGSDDDRVGVDIIIALFVTEPDKQVAILGSLIELVQRANWAAPLREAVSPAGLASAFDAAFASP
ncbi:PTS sugar transporter subunit IIA [uncultured Agrococcus sp.]|uniref:PTS sugar transporter subunit IIA n=1 Tax=uncultured Agrococcus sp. TaxID=382258 RepID=UPI0025D4ECED|nr:PTS sugar transporter subunit IIA [uncultured Agrococcus sp.]